MSKDYIIGIDHGNGFIKTAGTVFASGVEEYKVDTRSRVWSPEISGQLLCDWREPKGLPSG